MLYENDSMVVIIPFWAAWPFESMIVPKFQMRSILDLEKRMMQDFAEAIQWITIRYDNLFETSFPYSAGIHQSPTNLNEDNEAWHWHMSFYPPLLRSATVKKFMVGYEMFANPQRDITPEQAVQHIKRLSGTHYKNVL